MSASHYPPSWAIVPVSPNSKKPAIRDWNEPELCRVADDWDGNFGIAHSYSGTYCLDIDDFDQAEAWLAERGINLQQLLDAPDSVQIKSGRLGRAKLLGSLAEPLPTKVITIDGKTILEFRCATASGKSVQDLLPPSRHPDTGKEYTWELGPTADLNDLQPIDPKLHALWLELAKPSTSPPKGREGTTIDVARAMLAQLDPDMPREPWLEVGMALHHEFGDEGKPLYGEWSAKGEKYAGPKDIDERWDSFGKRKGGNLITIGTLRKMVGPTAEGFEALPPEDAPPPGKASRFRRIPIAEWAKGGTVNWLIKGILSDGGLGVIYGAPGSGKSFLAVDMGQAIARGVPWRGRKTRQGLVIYICAEGQGGAKGRARALSVGHGIDLATLPIEVIDDTPDLLGPDYIALAASVGRDASLIIIDTLAQTMAGGDENSSQDMGKALKACRKIHELTGATVLLVHHSGKDVDRGARGHSSLKGATDTEIAVTVDAAMTHTATVTKQKDGVTGIVEAFRLRQVVMGRDEDGEEITSCVVDPEVAPVTVVQKPKPRPAGYVQQVVLRVVNDLHGADGALRSEVEDAARGQIKVEGARDRRQQSIDRAIEGLIGKGRFAIAGDRLVLL